MAATIYDPTVVRSTATFSVIGTGDLVDPDVVAVKYATTGGEPVNFRHIRRWRADRQGIDWRLPHRH